MLSRTFALWKGAVRQPAVWTAVIWMGLLMLLTAGGIAITGGVPSSRIPLYSSTPFNGVVPGGGTGISAHAALIILLAGAVSTFIAAGEYGMFGRAVAGETVSWRSFWGYMFQYYGRLWGFVLYTLMWGVCLVLLAVALGLALHSVGVVLVLIAAFFSWPWAVRMMGGLFVDELSWGQSFSRAFQAPHYGEMLGAVLVALAAYVAAFAAIQLLGLLSAPLGLVLSWAVDLFLLAAGPVWLLAAYRSTTDRG